ncbi:MAG: tetratricopeptide repeat protein, partial [bacterium]|nr:tetratricopeptide repeat protein [bacterium]
MIIKNALLFVSLMIFFGISFCQEKKVELKDVVQEFQKNNFERVIELSDRAIKEGAQQPEFYFYLGFSYMKVSKNSEAVNFFRLFLKNAEYTQKNVWMLRQALNNLVSLYRNNKDFNSILDDANFFLEKIKSANLTEQLDVFCKNILVETLKEIGNRRAETRDYAGAIEAYKKILEYKPDDPNIISRIAVYYKNLGQNEVAAKYYLKSAMIWSSWTSKITPLVSIVEIFWETDRLNALLKEAETDSVSYNFLVAADEMKKKMYSEAFSRLRKLEDETGSKGDFSERLLRIVYSKRTDDPWMFYFFILNLPETSGSRWAADMLINLGRNNPEIEKTIKEKMLPAMMKLVEESTSVEVRKLFPKIFEMKFLGTPDSREIIIEKIKTLEQFASKYSEDPIIPDILKSQAILYTDNLLDYQKGKELFGLLIKKYNQKAMTVHLARCLINLGE